jgi:peptide-methionine (S)-S-oxide reductase
MRRSSLFRPCLLALLTAGACVGETHANEDLPAPKVDLHPKTKGPQTVVLAGGCFWCMEGTFERLIGVTDVTSGYAGGTAETANYDMVSDHKTQHAESIKVTYDPSKITFGQLLQVFFTVHDPTTQDRQGPDEGHQYRSAIFFADEEQKSVAAAYIQQLTAAKAFSDPIVTTLEPLTKFYPAEGYHQDYVRLHPNHPYIQAWFPRKVKKLHDHFQKLLKPEFAKN